MMQVIQTNGINIHYELSGKAGGIPLVFSNSLGTDFRLWDKLLPLLGDQYRFLRYDKRGHGLSECPPAPYHIQDHVEDLAELMLALNIENAIVCGLSVGGLVAQGLWAAHPKLIRALILCDTAHIIGPPAMWDDRLKIIKAQGIAALEQPILERWFSNNFRANNDAELAAWRHMLTRTPLDGYVGTAEAIRDADMTDAAKSINEPCLCIGGSEDGSTPPELMQTMTDLIPGAYLKVIDGVGHLPCVEKPEQMASIILEFLSEANLGR